jgi:two-component system, response regulator PdtaR
MVESEKGRILVADDDAVLLELIEKALSVAGYELYSAASGTQAVDIATTNPIDLALLDYRMPGLSGLEVAKTIHALTSTRFIMMSVHSEQELIMEAAGGGALAYLVKPLDIAEVVNTVRVQLVRAKEIRQYEASIKKMESERALDMSRAVTSARVVNTAVGVLMERFKINRTQAYGLLNQRARSNQQSLVSFSEEILGAAEIDYQLRPDSASLPAKSKKPPDQ